MHNNIVVIGSSNTDMVLKTSHFPKPGETILGGEFFVFQGGKGANQAVAAARLGGKVSFICRVGNDSFGNNAIQLYSGEGIDTTAIVKDGNASTGVAVITINTAGENSIIVASGANAFLSVYDVRNAGTVLQQAQWLVTQLETPLQVVEYLAGYCLQHQKKLILNPAPAAFLPNSVYKDLFLITPNETETAMLTGITVSDDASAFSAAMLFTSKGVQNVIITLGSKGAYVHTDSFRGMVNAPKVIPLDTTAAGDVFNGALVVALSEGLDWKEAVEFSCRAAAISVTKMGAQSSAPNRDELG